MRLAQRAEVNDDIVIELTAQRHKQVAEISLREGIAKAISEGQEPPTGVEKAQHGPQFLAGEEGRAFPSPAFLAGIITAGGGREDEQLTGGDFKAGYRL